MLLQHVLRHFLQPLDVVVAMDEAGVTVVEVDGNLGADQVAADEDAVRASGPVQHVFNTRIIGLAHRLLVTEVRAVVGILRQDEAVLLQGDVTAGKAWPGVVHLNVMKAGIGAAGFAAADARDIVGVLPLGVHIAHLGGHGARGKAGIIHREVSWLGSSLHRSGKLSRRAWPVHAWLDCLAKQMRRTCRIACPGFRTPSRRTS